MMRTALRTESVKRRHVLAGGDGFTLIEVMVAFIILALTTVVIQRAVMSASQGVVRAEQRIAAESVVRTLMSGPLGTRPDALMRRSGQMNGLEWVIQFDAVDLPFEAAAAADPKTAGWTPIKMTMSVLRPGAATPDLVVQTVRLVKL